MACKNSCMEVIDYLIKEGANPAIVINALVGGEGDKYRKKQLYFGEIIDPFCGICEQTMKKSQGILQCNDCKQCFHIKCKRKLTICTLVCKKDRDCLSCKNAIYIHNHK